MAEEVISSSALLDSYQLVISTLPPIFQNFVNLFLIVFIIFIYSVFIWRFHKFIAHKNIFGLNLNKYNHSEEPAEQKFLHGGFYFLEYMIILPFIILFWFGILTVFLISLTEGLEIKTIFIISATVVASIRMAAYYREDLAREFAKLLPFTLLAVSITDPGFFEVSRIITQFNQIFTSFGQISGYILFVVTVEFILRFFDFTFSLFGIGEEEDFWKENGEEN